MKIALIGYGKMGKTIERLALGKRHQIALRIDDTNLGDLNVANLRKADVAIEFTQPEAAFDNVKKCLEAGTAIVSGTTGWLDRFGEIEGLCHQHQGAFFYASNYSVGVNVFFALNQYLARLMNQQETYQVQIEEIHHTQKLDAPSGTAITIAEGILGQLERKSSWKNESSDDPKTLSILSKRLDEVPGTHIINYTSPIDDIQIKHTAFSREGFASGALMAAEWIVGKQGVFGMKDLLGF